MDLKALAEKLAKMKDVDEILEILQNYEPPRPPPVYQLFASTYQEAKQKLILETEDYDEFEEAYRQAYSSGKYALVTKRLKEV